MEAIICAVEMQQMRLCSVSGVAIGEQVCFGLLIERESARGAAAPPVAAEIVHSDKRKPEAAARASDSPTADIREKVLTESSSLALLPVTYAEAHWPIRQGVFGITRTCQGTFRSDYGFCTIPFPIETTLAHSPLGGILAGHFLAPYN